ncbi:hypothetical protein Pcinc_020333, partial [Petrolisthes cinctipes]
RHLPLEPPPRPPPGGLGGAWGDLLGASVARRGGTCQQGGTYLAVTSTVPDAKLELLLEDERLRQGARQNPVTASHTN